MWNSWKDLITSLLGEGAGVLVLERVNEDTFNKNLRISLFVNLWAALGGFGFSWASGQISVVVYLASLHAVLNLLAFVIKPHVIQKSKI